MFYWTWTATANFGAFWHSVYEPYYQRCSIPPLPGNRSGVKVLVYGLAKTGTRTMSRSLYQLGLRSYHSEELNLHIWSSLSDDFWRRPENGGRAHGSVAHLQFMLVGNKKPWTRYADGKRAMKGTSVEQWKRELSACRVEAVAFDGVEKLFWPVYEAADPGVRVISLDWRTFGEYSRSIHEFGPLLYVQTFLTGMAQVSFVGMPWPLVLSWMDGRILNDQLKTHLETGWPPSCQEYGLTQALYQTSVAGRRIMTHWFSGIGMAPFMRSEYQTYWLKLRQRVPASQIFHFDMKRHGWEDLCEITGIGRESCPKTGRLPRAVNLLNYEHDFPVTFACLTIITLIAHRINWFVINKFLDFYMKVTCLAFVGILRAWVYAQKSCLKSLKGNEAEANGSAGSEREPRRHCEHAHRQ